jgi:glycosyltransferase involved in cell wall biosynthesis
MMMTARDPDLSIVIPVFNEASKISRDIQDASEFLSGEGMQGEIIVVDDGSTDGTAGAARDTDTDEGIPLRIIENRVHRGKGHAVRTGVMNSRSGLVMFIDSGSCIPYKNIQRGMQLLEDMRCDIAHASRFLPESEIRVPRKPARRVASHLFRHFIRFTLPIPAHLTDTQCGLKIYPGAIAHELYAACRTDGFMFDIEIILRARSKGYRIMEFPVEWSADNDSRLRVTETIPRMFRELRKIRRTIH